MTREGEGTAGSTFWTLVFTLIGVLIGRWSTARSMAAQADALAAALDRVRRLEAENDRLRDEAAQRADAQLPQGTSIFGRPIIRVKLHPTKKRRRRM